MKVGGGSGEEGGESRSQLEGREQEAGHVGCQAEPSHTAGLVKSGEADRPFPAGRKTTSTWASSLYIGDLGRTHEVWLCSE